MLEKQAVDMVATPTHGIIEGNLTNGLPIAGVTSDLDSENSVGFVMLPNHLKATMPLDTPPTTSNSTPPPSTPPPDAVTPPTPQPRGGIISM